MPRERSEPLDPIGASNGGQPTKTAPPATAREELIFLLCGVWQMVGLCLDGWAHQTRPELESFFTPWHAVFYGGFTASVSWLAYLTIRRRPYVNSLRAAIPRGYGLSVVGIVIFAVGGFGDSLWHTAFGIESGIDALVSPTHLLLFIGILMASSGPIRSALARPGADRSFVSFLPITLSISLVTAGVAFFFLYANGFHNWAMTVPFEEGGGTDSSMIVGLLSTLTTTIILLSPTLYLQRRWHVPTGSFTVIYGLVGCFLIGLDGFAFWWEIVASLVGGGTADVVSRWSVKKYVAWVTAVAVPITMWSTSTILIDRMWSVAWPPELWVGQIVLAAVCGIGIVVISSPSRPVAETRD